MLDCPDVTLQRHIASGVPSVSLVQCQFQAFFQERHLVALEVELVELCSPSLHNHLHN